MKLKLRRDQQEKKGLFGGSKGFDFRLTFQVELSPEERELIKRYKIGDYLLATYKIRDTELPVRVGSLQEGHTSVVEDVTELLELEEKIKAACQNLKSCWESWPPSEARRSSNLVPS